MRTSIDVARGRLEVQGFFGLDDNDLREVWPWLRLAPAICMTWTAVATVLASPAGLLALATFAALGAVLRNHPFDVIHELGIRRVLGTRRLPRYPVPRRFACAMATVWLLAAAGAFASGLAPLGYVLGGGLVVAAGVQTFTGICLPSLTWRRLFGWPELEDARRGTSPAPGDERAAAGAKAG